MGLRDVWNRSLVYFGIAEEDEYLDEDEFSAAELNDGSPAVESRLEQLATKCP